MQWVFLVDAITVLLKKKCQSCSASLASHAVGAVSTRSNRSWTSSHTMALTLSCPVLGSYQPTLPGMELRLRIIHMVELAPLPPIHPNGPNEGERKPTEA